MEPLTAEKLSLQVFGADIARGESICSPEGASEWDYPNGCRMSHIASKSIRARLRAKPISSARSSNIVPNSGPFISEAPAKQEQAGRPPAARSDKPTMETSQNEEERLTLLDDARAERHLQLGLMLSWPLVSI